MNKLFFLLAQDMFYTFARTGELPQNKDVSEGVYQVWI